MMVKRSSIKSQKYRFNINRVLKSNKIMINLVIFALCSSVGFAGTMQAFATSTFHGLYVGGSGGGSFLTATSNVSSSTMIDFPNTLFGTREYTSGPFNSVTSLKNNSGIGALFVGYGLDFKRLYIGAEGFVNYSNYQMTGFGNTGSTRFFSNFNQSYILNDHWESTIKASPFQFGLDLRPGFLLKPEMLFYGRVGFASVKLTQSGKSEGAAVYSFGGFSNSYPFALNPSNTSNKIALRLGTGFEYYFLPKWSARMDYIYVNYGTVNSNGRINTPAIGRGFEGNGTLEVTNNVNVKSLATNTIMIGISRYFS